jgi:hypothetical protein
MKTHTNNKYSTTIDLPQSPVDDLIRYRYVQLASAPPRYRVHPMPGEDYCPGGGGILAYCPYDDAPGGGGGEIIFAG